MTNNIIRVGEKSEKPDNSLILKNREGTFCGGPVVKMLHFQCRVRFVLSFLFVCFSSEARLSEVVILSAYGLGLYSFCWLFI